MKRAANTFPEHSLLIQPLYIYILEDGGILLRFIVLCFKEYTIYGIGTFSRGKKLLKRINRARVVLGYVSYACFIN